MVLMRIALGISVFCCWLLSAHAADNLVVDASFESALPSWFNERMGTSYYAGKEPVSGAADGRMVLAIEGWDRAGSRVLSGPIRLNPQKGASPRVSATAAVRSFGKTEGATFELALFDESGKKKLATFGQTPLDGKGTWQTVSQTGVELSGDVTTCRLGLVPAGPQDGARIEVDCVGLFQGSSLQKVADNGDLAVVEAEELADGKIWQAVDHYGGWYQGTPSGMKMLAGPHGIGAEENRPISRSLPVGHAGPHTLWIRLLSGPYAGRFTVALRQGGDVVAQKDFAENDPKHGQGYRWVWDSLEADLRPGEVELVLTRPAAGTSWVTRKIDLLVLTNRPDYVPEVEHFRTQGYLRFTNSSAQQEPFCLWIFVRRHQGPRWYANPGILSRAGFSEGYYVPDDRSKWLACGGRSPWVPIGDYLLAAGQRNNIQLIATRKAHTGGFVTGRIQGRLEFAVGPDRRVVKTVEIDQDAPRVLMTLPYDFQEQPEQIKTALDYIRETEAEIARLEPMDGKPAVWMNLSTNVNLQAGVDDPEALRREIGILKGLGFNQTYHLVAPPEDAVEFCREHGLLARFGGGLDLWRLTQHNSQHHPDLEAMRKNTEKFAEQHRGILDRYVRAKLMDEPGGMSYESIAGSEPCRQKFREWLKGQGLAPERLGVKTWEEVVPVLPDQSDAKPELFYYTGLFRLEAFATLAKACVQVKKALLPDTMLTFVNYSPPTSGGSWTERGTDLFLAHRQGGMELIWTEDWLGYSLGPQHLSDTLALCRAAGRPDNRPLGAYCVGQATPELMRMKYYTLAAGGVRDIECYDYGPWYAGIDSWGRRFDLYPAIRQCNFELGAIDPYLHGTVRRKAEVAILYNRTASIWAKKDNTCLLNGSFTHWALAHAGFDADYLAEEDVEAGELSRYKVLYLDGRQLRRQSAAILRDWVEQGGVLFASAGAASRDEYNRAMEILDAAFGARSEEFETKAAAGRPKYELRGLKALDHLEPADPAETPVVGLDQLCYQERLDASDGAQVILVDGQKRPAGTLNKAGRGTAIRVAALPGISYAHEAAQPPYDPDSYLPRTFRAELRDFIAWPAKLAGAVPVATTESPIAEIVRYDADDRAIVFAIDHRAEPAERFTFVLHDAAGFARAITASGNPVELKDAGNGRLSMTLPINQADAVVLLRASQGN